MVFSQPLFIDSTRPTLPIFHLPSGSSFCGAATLVLGAMAMKRGKSLIEEEMVGDALQVMKPMRFRVSVSYLQHSYRNIGQGCRATSSFFSIALSSLYLRQPAYSSTAVSWCMPSDGGLLSWHLRRSSWSISLRGIAQ